MGTSGDINGWHGQPHQMNMPSLSKGECFLECSWTRTFKATKAGSWDVSFEYYNEGFTLEASETQFTVSEGEEIEIEFTAKALQGLNVKWTNGRVVLTPSDTSMPVQTLPAAINFIAGSAPAITEITAGRTNDSMGVKGITTIGTDNLQLSKSGLAKADIHEFELMRDASNNIIYHWDNPESPTIKVFPLNIQADSKRLVVEVLETTSPDLDIYIGIDVDVNGQPSVLEMDYFWKMSATETAFELIDEIDPRNDTYWVMVHNWAEGPAEISEDQMICEEGQEPDEGKTCAEAPIMDSVKLAITNVVYDEDNMTVAVPTSVAPREEIDTRVQWQQEMMEGDIYHGVFWLGTSAELNKNIGAVRVNMMRGGDDIKVSEPVQNDDKMSFEIVVAANNSQEDRKYDFSVEIAEGSTIANIVQDTVVEGASLQMAPTDVEYTINGNVVSWTHNQAIADVKVMFSVVLDIADVQGMIDATPVIESAVSTSEVTETTTSAMPVFVEGRPIFTASASLIEVKEGKPITLKANLVDGVIENPEISYSWRQTSGTTVTGSQLSGQSITFNAPKVSSDETVVFELIGSNGSKTALPVQASFKVQNKSSGGITGIFFLALSLLALRLKRNN